jgi:hypothetical protein
MRLIARWGLRLVTAATSVFIAACYGIPYDGPGGRVVRRGTVDLFPEERDVGIPGIDVSCLDVDGAILERDLTGEDGAFYMHGPCTAIAAEDVDGDANGGAFSPRTVPVEGDYVRIELVPAP